MKRREGRAPRGCRFGRERNGAKQNGGGVEGRMGRPKRRPLVRSGKKRGVWLWRGVGVA